MYKQALNIGTLAGIAAFALFLLMYYIGLSPISIGKFTGFWIPIVAILWVNLKVRREVLGGYLTYAQGFLTGLLTVLVWSTFKGFSMYIFMILFDQHVIDQYIQFTESYFAFLENFSGESFEQKPEIQEMMKGLTPWKIMLGDINMNIIFGALCTFIIPFITKRTPRHSG